MRRFHSAHAQRSLPHEVLRTRFLLITLLFGFAAAAACGNGQDSGDRAGQVRGRSPHEAVAKRRAIQAMAEERIRTSMPKSYDCDHFNLKRVEQVELTPGHLAASDKERWCLHLEYECRTGPTGKQKEFASVVEVIYADTDASVVTELAMGPLFTWADPGFVGVNGRRPQASCATGAVIVIICRQLSQGTLPGRSPRPAALDRLQDWPARRPVCGSRQSSVLFS